MQAVLDLGADIINDVWALRWQSGGENSTGMDVVRQHPSCGICLMHMRDPQTMQVAPMEGDAYRKCYGFCSGLRNTYKA